jgi:hypothetical protein
MNIVRQVDEATIRMVAAAEMATIFLKRLDFSAGGCDETAVDPRGAG